MDFADEALDSLHLAHEKRLAIGPRVKSVRNYNKLTQAEFADILGISRAQIANIEAGNSNLTTEHIVRICGRFGVTSDYLLGLGKIKINETALKLAQLQRKLEKIKGVLAE